MEPEGKRFKVETNEESLMDKILRIPVITDQIWRHVTLDQLRACRQVNVVWKEASTAEIIRRNVGSLQFSRRQGSSLFVLTKSCPTSRFKVKFPAFVRGVCAGLDVRREGLQDLSRLLTRGQELAHLRNLSSLNYTTTYSSFPLSSFTFTDGDLTSGSSELKIFLDKHGQHVQTLRLERIALSSHILDSLLGEKLNNIRKLSIVSSKFINVDLDLDRNRKLEDDEDSSSSWSLPFLTTIHIDLEDSPDRPQILPILILQLMKGAPNLKAIGNFPRYHHDLPTFFPKPRTMSLVIGLVISWTEMTPTLGFVSKLPVRLRILTLTKDLPLSETNHLLNILKNSAHFLSVLHVKFSRIFSMTPFSSLVLPNVQHLTVDVGDGPGKRLEAAVLLRIFPNLTSIYIRFMQELIPGHEEQEMSSRKKIRLRGQNEDRTTRTTTCGCHGCTGNHNHQEAVEISSTSIIYSSFIAGSSSVQFPLVEKLEILGDVPKTWWKLLMTLFPQVHRLTWNPVHDHYADYIVENGRWKYLKEVVCGHFISASPVKTRHERFVLSLS